jgi:hypothetical protein
MSVCPPFQRLKQMKFQLNNTRVPIMAVQQSLWYHTHLYINCYLYKELTTCFDVSRIAGRQLMWRPIWCTSPLTFLVFLFVRCCSVVLRSYGLFSGCWLFCALSFSLLRNVSKIGILVVASLRWYEPRISTFPKSSSSPTTTTLWTFDIVVPYATYTFSINSKMTVTLLCSRLLHWFMEWQSLEFIIHNVAVLKD